MTWASILQAILLSLSIAGLYAAIAAGLTLTVLIGGTHFEKSSWISEMAKWFDLGWRISLFRQLKKPGDLIRRIIFAWSPRGLNRLWCPPFYRATCALSWHPPSAERAL